MRQKYNQELEKQNANKYQNMLGFCKNYGFKFLIYDYLEE